MTEHIFTPRVSGRESEAANAIVILPIWLTSVGHVCNPQLGRFPPTVIASLNSAPCCFAFAAVSPDPDSNCIARVWFSFGSSSVLVRANFVWLEGANCRSAARLRPLALGHNPALAGIIAAIWSLAQLLLPK
jgi:hypothetical protein